MHARSHTHALNPSKELARKIAAFENELLDELRSEGVDLDKVNVDDVGVDEEMESILQLDEE